MDRRDFIEKSLAAGAISGAALAAGKATAGPATANLRSNYAFDKAETPVILEVAINGSVNKKVNPTAPETPAEIAEQAIQCLDGGATIVHAHTNQPMEDAKAAAQVYVEAFSPVRKKYPHAILYPTANFDPPVYHENRRPWKPEIQCGHYRPLAESGAANMVLFDTGVVPIAVYDDKGMIPEEKFWWYGFWPGDNKIVHDVCKDLGTGASISVFEPGWMKNVVAMAKAGTLPRGSKVIMYFADYGWAGMAPPIPEALELYLHMIEGLDLKMVDRDDRRLDHGHPPCPHGTRTGRQLPRGPRGLLDRAKQSGTARAGQGNH